MAIAIKVFAVIGVGFTALIIACLLGELWGISKEARYRRKRKKKMKNRFNKPPLAKCYCIDCESYSASDSSSGYCYAHKGWGVADCWFCWSATPKKYNSPADEVSP
jgi:hypothetical protein